MIFQFQAKDYTHYFEANFRHRWLRPAVLDKKLAEYRDTEVFKRENFGQSEEGRELSCLRYGNGPVRIMIWTQMHGNEPTATMALVDLLRFLSGEDQTYNSYKQQLAEEVSLLMVPMLNPDGAERFTRRNALQIDMNRDAQKRESAEMKAFHSLFEEFRPHWGFNLHDQRSFFSAGTTARPATISFLAASADEDRRITKTREMSMKLIGGLTEVIHNEIPGHVGRYSDEFYPTALGEFFHSQEVPCVLIESGAYLRDPFRDVARKMNFLLLLRAFEMITQENWGRISLDIYHAIPENGKAVRDLVIRHCKFRHRGKTIEVDMGFTIDEKPDVTSGDLKRYFKLVDLGDLEHIHGMEERKGGVIEAGEMPDPDRVAHFSIQLPEGGRLIFDNGILRTEKH